MRHIHWLMTVSLTRPVSCLWLCLVVVGAVLGENFLLASFLILLPFLICTSHVVALACLHMRFTCEYIYTYIYTAYTYMYTYVFHFFPRYVYIHICIPIPISCIYIDVAACVHARCTERETCDTRRHAYLYFIIS